MENKTILLVEDNLDDETLTIRALQKANLANKVVVARDGAEALDYLLSRGQYEGQNNLEDLAVVLLDLKLPKVDGIEVLKEIRKNPVVKFLPVVILTSSDEEEDLLKSYNFGANSYIKKPVDFEQFYEAVKQLGMYWLLINRVPRNSE